jgi:hypothetical protein
VSVPSVNRVASTTGPYRPTPARIPIAAVIQMDAAVVSPRTDSPSFMMTPAPRKPMPVITPCAIRVGSIRTVSGPAFGNQVVW